MRILPHGEPRKYPPYCSRRQCRSCRIQNAAVGRSLGVDDTCAIAGKLLQPAFASIDTAGGLKQLKSLANCGNIVHANYLNTLPSK